MPRTDPSPFSNSWVLDLETYPVGDAEAFIEPPTAPANYKDPVKIEAFIQEAWEERIAAAALDIDLARIVALGITPYVGTGSLEGHPAAELGEYLYAPDKVNVTLFRTEAEEAAMLEHMRPHFEESRLITFNGSHYDIPLLCRRYLYLGLRPLRIETDRYRTQNLDLYAKLCHYSRDVKAHKLAWYVKRHNWTDLESDQTGADIGALVKADDWETIVSKVQKDVAAAARLAAWMGITQP